MFKKWQVALPVALGLTGIGWLFADEFNAETFAAFHMTWRSVALIMLACALMLLRDVAMMGRFRLSTNKVLSWKQAFEVNVLSEFVTAITPTAIGGSSLLAFFLHKEGVAAGQSAVVMLFNLLCDELYFVIACPIFFLLLPLHLLIPPAAGFITAIGFVFVALYAVHLLWATLLFIGIFIQPIWVKRLLTTLFKLPLLRRWSAKVATLSDHIVIASHDIRRRPATFWIRAMALTFVAWTGRFLVVNVLFLAFVPTIDNVVVFARQIMLWVFMAVMPTPGGSGMSEVVFKEYYGDLFIPGAIMLFVTVIWRLLSYYLYLLLGVIILPKWWQKAR